jgi:glycosyltransferase involved in cell wall biosynthesis
VNLRRPFGLARRALASAAARARDAMRHSAIARTPAATGSVHVFYGYDRIPSLDEAVHGGMVKFQALARVLPNAPRDFNLLYLGSSTAPRDAGALVRLARERGAPFAWNQNGVAYPGLYGPRYEAINAPLRECLRAADHVVFQSAFCKLSAERFLGAPRGTWEILHNPVDTSRFTPGVREGGAFTLLLGGNQYQRYRFEAALRTLELVHAELPDARLLVSGALSWQPDRRLARREADELLARAGLAGHVELLGTYTQAEAPDVMRRGDVLLHTKYNDPCPTIVLEAMACGLPVVYSASGGTPELVGDEAGVGVEAPLDFDADHPPDPDALAAAVVAVHASLGDFRAAARRRAERFDLTPWVERHRALFEELLRA